MGIPTALSISPIYIALLGLFFIPITLRVGAYRVSNKISLGDGGDPELLKRMRGQANFIETVPLVALMLVMMDVTGASLPWLHTVGALILGGRLLHYVGLTGIGPFVCRPIGIFATLGAYLAASGWLIYSFI